MKILNSLTDPLKGIDGSAILYQAGEKDGQPILKAETAGRMLANLLARGQSEDAVRAMVVAMELHGKAKVELEDADFSMIQKAVTADTQLTNLGRAACLTALSNAKEK